MPGYEFLPSPEWVADSRIYAGVFGVVGAVTAHWWVRKLLGTPETTKRHQIINDLIAGPGFFLSREKRRKIGLALVPLAGFAAGYMLIVKLLPMAITFATGKRIELAFEVDRIAQNNHCRFAVYLVDMPFGQDPLCGLPEWFSISLKPGDSLLIKGIGSDAGIFIDTVRAVPGEGALLRGG